MTFCALLGTASTLHYSNAIVVAKEDNEARDVLKLSFLINFCFSLLVAIVLLFFRSAISALYNIPSLTPWLLVAPVSVFFAGLNTIFSAWSVRKKKFKLLSKNRIYTAFIAPFFSIIIGFILIGPAGLFIGLLVSQIIPTIRMSYYFFKQDEFDFHFESRRLIAASKQFRNFPRFSLPADFINNLSNQIPVLMLGHLGGSHVVGWYNLSVRMLGLPSTLIATAVSDVFRQRATNDFHTFGSCRSIFLKVFKTLVLVSIVPFAILLLFGPSIFSFVFGEQWREAGKIAQVIGVLYVFKFVVSPLTYVTYIAGKQWVGLLMDILLLVTLLALLYISQHLGLSYMTSLFLLSTSYSLLYILTFYLSYKFSISEKIIQPG
jgi:O-antigen/teichoic acid export membrane protein